ncbi:transmembrane protein 119 [Lissotriton helveticus]
MSLQVTLCMFMVLLAPLCLARYTPTDHDNGGSGDYSTLPTSPLNNVLSTDIPEDEIKNSYNGTTTGKNILDGILDFFKEYMLLMIVVGSLVFMMIFIVCAAVIVRQKNQATAYYPSSFPKKKYVDEKDKNGGPQAFSEVPEKSSDIKPEEPVDCTKKLQADIIAVAHNLKSPSKTVANGEPATIEEQPVPEENIKNEDSKVKGEDICNGLAVTKKPEKSEPVKEATSGTEVSISSDKGGETSTSECDQPAGAAIDHTPVAKGGSNDDSGGGKAITTEEIPLNECSGRPATVTQIHEANVEV